MKRGLLILLPALALAMLTALAGRGPALEQGDDGSLPEIRRVLLEPERLAAELDRARKDALVKMPQAEFETLVKKAQEARKPAEVATPRLLEAQYRATLVEEAPVRADKQPPSASEGHLIGSARWTVQNTGNGPGILPLEPFSLAPGQPRFENRDALFGDFDRATPGLLVDRPGRHSVVFSFSSRGDPTPEGLHFDWRVPPCAVAALELNVPANRAVSVAPDTCLVTGPHRAEAADRALWRIHFAQRSVLHITVLPAEGTTGDPSGAVVVEQVRARHHLHPDGDEAEFAFDLRAPARGLRSLTFECDPPLVPYRVTLASGEAALLDRWEYQPPKNPDQRSMLTLHLARPVRGTLQPRVWCQAPVRGNEGGETRPWDCPSLSLRSGALAPRGETIELRCHSQLRLEEWWPGEFRLASAETETDGTQRLNLTATGLAPSGADSPGNTSARPRALLRGRGADYHARLLSWWRPDEAVPLLHVQAGFELRHGRLFEVPLWVPSGWVVERVSLSHSPERLRNWNIRPASQQLVPALNVAGKPGQLLMVEFQPPLEPPSGIEDKNDPPIYLNIHLRAQAGRPRQPAPLAVALPIVVPVGATTSEGGLAVDWRPESFGASFTQPGSPRPRGVRVDVPLPTVTAPVGEVPWGANEPGAYFSWRATPPVGTLRLVPHPSRGDVHVVNEILPGPARLELTSRLTLRLDSGSAAVFDMDFSPPGTTAPRPEVEVVPAAPGVAPPRVVRLERNHAGESRSAARALAAPSPLSAAANVLPVRTVEQWRATVSPPVRAGESITLIVKRSFPWPPREGEGPWDVPLVTLSDWPVRENELRLPPVGDGWPAGVVATVGLREVTPTPGTDGNWRIFREEAPFARVRLGRLPETPAVRPRHDIVAAIPRASLVTRAENDGRLIQRATFLVRDWSARTFPVRLPAGARLISLRVDGRDARGVAAEVATESGEVELAVPLPSGGNAIPLFEIVYSVEAPRWRLFTRLEAPMPVFPVQPLTLRQVWRLPAGFAPVVHRGLLRWPGAAVEERSTPDRWARSLGTLVSRALTLDRWAARQEPGLRTADSRFRKTLGGQTWTLGEALSRLAIENLSEQGEMLVIDTAALSEGGLSPATLLSVGPANPEGLDQEGDAGPPAGPVLDSLAAHDLVYVPCRGAPLVTTGRQWRAWQRLGGDGAERPTERDLPQETPVAVVEAARFGRDASGRFQAALDWAESGAAFPRPDAASIDGLIPGDGEPGWVDWEAVEADRLAAPLTVIRTDLPAGLGLLLAGLLVITTWRSRHDPRENRRPAANNNNGGSTLPLRGSRRSLAVLLFWVAASGLGQLWLPAGLRDLAWWPLVVGTTVALWWYLVPGPRERAQSERPAEGGSVAGPRSVPGGVASAGVVALFFAAWSVGPASQPPSDPRPPRDLPKSYTVYLVPEGKEPPAVLVPPALLERLRAATAPRVAPGAAIVAAEYQAVVKPDGKSAQIQAVFQVWCHGPDPVTLELPLDGVALLPESLLDGARTYPTALPSPSIGYSLRVVGAGVHKVQLSFLARIDSLDGLNDLRFIAPRVVQSRARLSLPPGAYSAQALAKLGAQRVTGDGSGTKVEADLGPVGANPAAILPLRQPPPPTVPLHFRWRTDRPDAKPRVRYREAYLWDLDQRGHVLTGVLQYQIDRGAVSRLDIDLPADLEVGRIEVRRLGTGPESEAGSAGQVRLRDWRLSSNGKAPDSTSARTLHMDFQAPISGSVQMLLILYPRGGLFDPPRESRPFVPGLLARQATVTLPLPRPNGEPLSDGGALAYRLRGLEAQPISTLLVAGIDPGDFPSFFWQAAGRGDGPPAYACLLRRTADKQPILTLGVRVQPARREATQQLTWRVGPVQADLLAVLDVKAPDGDLALVEWEVPAQLQVSAIRGPDVRSWSWAKGVGAARLQVWLRKSVSRSRIEMSASTLLTRGTAPDTRWLVAGGALGHTLRDELSRSSVFLLAPLRVMGMDRSPAATQIELRGVDGMALSPHSVSQLTPGDATSAGVRLAYTSQRGDFAGRFAVVPARMPVARVSTVIEVAEGKPRFRSRLDLRFPPGATRTLDLRLTGGPSAGVKIEAPGARATEIPAPTGSRSWALSWPEKETTAEVRVEGTWSGGETSLGLLAPGVRPVGATVEDRWLVLPAGAAAYQPEGLPSPAARVPPAISSLSGPSGRSWRLAEDDDAIVLRESVAGRVSPVDVVWKESVAALPDGRRWLYQTTWHLYHQGPTEIGVTWPDGTEVIGIDVRGQNRTLPANRAGSVKLDSRGAKVIRAWWYFPDEQDGTASPTLLEPRIEAEGEFAVLWQLWLPPHRRGGEAAGFREGPLAAAQTAAARAEGQARLIRLLVEGGAASGPGEPSNGALERAVQSFARNLREAEGWREAAPATDREGQTGRAVLDLVQRLREENRTLLRERGLEALRTEAERRSWQGEDVSETTSAGDLLDPVLSPGRPLDRIGKPSPRDATDETTLEITDAAHLEYRQAMVGTGVLLGILVAVWLLSSFAGLVSRARTFWPEQAVVLGLLGWVIFGPTVPVLFVAAIGVLARLFFLAAGLLAVLGRPASEAAKG